MGQGWLSPWAIYDEATGTWIWKSGDPLLPQWTFPSNSGKILYSLNSANPTITHVEHFNKILAAAADSVRNDEDLSAALPITFTIDAQPDVPRTLAWAFNSHAQITAFTLVFTGVNAKGATITETFTAADGWSGETVNAFATITSIELTTRTGTGAGDTMDIGVGSKIGLANDIAAAADVFKVVKSAAAGNAADYSGATNVTPDATYDLADVSTGAAIVAGDSFTISYKTLVGNMS
jgi:hypothetical protein